MRTDAKVGLVAVLILVVLVIIYFAFHNSSSQTEENNALPSAQPALVEAPNLPGSSSVPPAMTQPSQTQPELISLPATAVTSMPATMPGLEDQTTTTMPAPPAMDQNAAGSANTGPAASAGNSNAALSLNAPASGTDNSGNSSGTAGNANSNATLNFPPVSTGSSGTSSTALRTRHHHGRTLTLSAPHSGIYIVRKGDTLAVISDRIYGNQRMIHALERANPGLDPRRMRIGQKIRLPRHGGTTLETRYHTSHPRHHTYASSSHGGQIYVVRSGEDLYDIALKFYHHGGMWKKIYNANRRIIGPSPNNLRAGERIVIPAR